MIFYLAVEEPAARPTTPAAQLIHNPACLPARVDGANNAVN